MRAANRAKNIDDHKHDSVSKSKDGKGEWKKELASNSEAAVSRPSSCHVPATHSSAYPIMSSTQRDWHAQMLYIRSVLTMVQIKADRDEIKNAGEDIKKLQKEAEELGKKKQ